MSKNPKGEFQSVGDAIRQLLHSYHIESKFDEASIVNSWEKLVGTPIAKRTKKVFIKNKVLFVHFKTAAMKHDFLLHKPHILELFRKEFGNDAIADIVIL
jgi:predicted nucleic acid-binding Zn ribbon protein